MSTLTTRSGKGSPLTNTEVDTNFTNLNTDKFESGDDITVDDITVSGRFIVGVDASVTAAGTTQGTATALTKTYNIVNTASANQGVALPDASAGTRVTIFNSTTATIKIYPYTNESINDLTANAALSLGPEKGRDFVAVSATQWQSTDEGDAVVATTIDASGLASLDGGIDVDGAFSVADTSGNIDTSGTLTVDSLSSLDGGIDVNGSNFTVGTDGDITTAGDLSVTGTTTLSGDLKYGITASITAAGSTQGDATSLTETVNVVTTASANQGVKLKSAVAGLKVEIYNNTSANIKVYPNTSDTIDGGSANAAKTLGARSSMILVCSNSTDWEIQRPIAIYNSSGTLLN
jgi:cytoskeletal protein CcmA (bactofilin family)